MLTTALIVLPIVGALVVAVAPASARDATAGLAFLVALAEVGALDRRGRALRLRRRRAPVLGELTRVGREPRDLVLGRLLRLLALARGRSGRRLARRRSATRSGSAATARVRTTRSMLFLTGAVVATFAAQDLLLFYVSFEAMLIPLYVLVGVWGGARSGAATLTFVVYTMAGSLLMLASVVAFGVTQGTFSLLESGTSDNVWIFLGFAVAFAIKAPLFPLPRLAAARRTARRRSRSRPCSRASSRRPRSGGSCDRLAEVPRARRRPARGACSCSRLPGSCTARVLAFRSPDLRGIVAYSSHGADGPDHLGVFAPQRRRRRRRDPPVGEPRPHLRRACSCSSGWSSGAAGRASSHALGGMARGRPGARDGRADSPG